MKYLMLSGLILLAGCTTKKELVYVPTKCEVDIPKSPIYYPKQSGGR